MNKTKYMITRLLTLFGIFAFAKPAISQNIKSLYDFTVTDINGKVFEMSQLKGKKVMIVNVASKCGFTPQYKDLQELYLKYKDHNFVIIGFPANNFLSQEPGNDSTIKSFCSLNYGVTFPMMSKVSVKGSDTAPIFKWLQNKSENGVDNGTIYWNFYKFLIDENGKWVKSFGSTTKPMSEEIIKWIEGQ